MGFAPLGCTHNHLSVALRADTEAPPPASSDHLRVDFDELAPCDLRVHRGPGVAEVVLRPHSGHTWRLEWQGTARYFLLVACEEDLRLLGGKGRAASLPASAAVGLLLGLDGRVAKLGEGDGSEPPRWEPFLVGRPVNRSREGHRHPHHH
ncbi:MAG: hypothetical protein D6731_00580 [Planctomycetota bacterium]|nr:MAG: hypothetical protein D6731_00580 [Planctomycetota bacterium]